MVDETEDLGPEAELESWKCCVPAVSSEFLGVRLLIGQGKGVELAFLGCREDEVS